MDGSGVYRRLGWKMPLPHKLTAHAPLGVPLAAPPAAASCREHGPGVIYDQKGIGSCTAFSALTLWQYVANKHLAAIASPRLSELALYYWTRVQYENDKPDDDGGASVSDTLKCLSEIGSPLETSWPYIDDGVQFGVEPDTRLFPEAKAHRALLINRVPTLRALQWSIAQGFPVNIGISVPQNMMSDECFHSGIVKLPVPGEAFVGGHALVADEYDGKYVSGPNQWSEYWGDAGRYHLEIGFFAAGLVSDAHTLRRVAA